MGLVQDDLLFPYYKKKLDLLRPWSTYLDLNSTSLIHLLSICTFTERNIAFIHLHRNRFNLAESHSQRALSSARQYEGVEEQKIDLLCKTLRICGNLQATQGNYVEAVAFAEEAYDCVAIAYNPVHPKVQEAADNLIQYLAHKGNLYNAERFAEATLDSLKDPANKLNQQSEEVAIGYYNLANVIIQQKQGDLVKAEMLARKLLLIRTGLERALAIAIAKEGPERINTVGINANLGSS
jgi:hypothetical protein